MKADKEDEKDEKDENIKGALDMASKLLAYTFQENNLTSYMKCITVNEETGEEFELIFKKIK